MYDLASSQKPQRRGRGRTNRRLRTAAREFRDPKRAEALRRARRRARKTNERGIQI